MNIYDKYDEIMHYFDLFVLSTYYQYIIIIYEFINKILQFIYIFIIYIYI